MTDTPAELDYQALDAALDAADDAYLAEGDDNLAFKKAVLTAIKTYLAAVETELPAVKVKALPEKPKPVCRHVHDHVICAGRGSAFNVYRCRYCGDEEWL